ncbi:iron-siderophore ABC transporter substrate-binding protein [Roseateles sp. DAIF2]|uniref:iron-siderophore ABC transporter substrate-binding protein n=1 Tax=Roseateles sp. DAIF2 TaxID=2714952 RepID=UPI0018A274D9|nr:iron-siderophore ABC transporter substrate-binding protein [Roseateles sp. DAIF2]QPF72900.1 iron-siderophore ABC transporter substrate-binding protein [Roseateles sp. DAIF2]
MTTINKRRSLLLALPTLLLAALPALAQPAAAPTREISDASGRKLTVPAQPQRVLVLSEKDLDVALALGVKPVGSTLGRGQLSLPAYLMNQAGNLPNVGAFAQPSMDRVLALRPDLILAGGFSDPQLLAQLSKIAPTFISYPALERWQDTTLRVGDLLGRGGEAKAFIAQYQARATTLRGKVGALAGKSASIVRWTPQGPVYMKADAFAGQVLADLGLTRPAAQQEPGAGHSGPLSREALAKIDGDWLFLGMFKSGRAHDPEALAALMRQPEFRELRAAKAGQVREVDASLWTVTGGPLAALAVLDETERVLLGSR